MHMPLSTVIYEIPTRVQKMEIKASASSKDLQVVTTTLALNYRVDPAHVVDVFRDLGPLDEVRRTIIEPAKPHSSCPWQAARHPKLFM